MVLSLGTGLLGLGLAMPTGLAFGFGYGYGVRQGYHSFSPSKSPNTRNLYANPDPIKGALGQGLLSAEERTKTPLGLNEPPSIGKTKQTVDRIIGGPRKKTTIQVRPTQDSTGRDPRIWNKVGNKWYLNPDYVRGSGPYKGQIRKRSSFKDRESYYRFIHGQKRVINGGFRR